MASSVHAKGAASVQVSSMWRKLLVIFSQFSGVPQVTTPAEAKSPNASIRCVCFKVTFRFVHEGNLLRTPLIPQASAVLLDARHRARCQYVGERATDDGFRWRRRVGPSPLWAISR